MEKITSEEEFDKAMTEHATPIVEQTFTKEDIKALREYLDKLEELSKVPPPVKLTPEEWDEALKAIEQTGEIPAKYAGRIGKRELTGAMLPPAQAKRRKEGEKFFAYYDIAFEEYHAQFYTVREEYRREIEKVIIANLAGQTTTKKTGGDIADLIKSILDNPEIMRELEKEARRLERRELPSLGALPNGEALNFLIRLLSGKSGRIPAAGKIKNGIITHTPKTNGDLIITKKTGKTETTFEIEKANMLFGHTNKGFTKVLTFVMQEMATQSFPLWLGFPLKVMVDLGIYKNTSNAARGLRDFFDRQDKIKVSGKLKANGKIAASSKDKMFFKLIISKSGFATLGTNADLIQTLFASYFTIFPSWAYKLGINAFLLVRFIFFIARQRTEEIKQNEKFKISLDAVRENLGLPVPEEVKNRRYREAIIEPIEAAIEEIETEANLHPETKDYAFTMTLARTETSKINEWLQGYLEIGLKRDFAETFVRIATEREEKQAQWEKAKQAELAKLEAKAEYAAKKE